MFGAICKSYYAEKANIDPKDIVVVSIMPCTAKKFEVSREEMINDVDISLTTRELGDMIKRAGIDFVNLPDETCDDMVGVASGAAHIFGATGGVMEAALRTVYEIVTGKELDPPDFNEVRGVAGIKEAEYDLNGTKVKVAVTSGLENASKLLDKIRSRRSRLPVCGSYGMPRRLRKRRRSASSARRCEKLCGFQSRKSKSSLQRGRFNDSQKEPQEPRSAGSL